MILILLCFIDKSCFTQNGKDVDTMINEGRGTFVIREIKKESFLSRDSSRLKGRIFQPFFKQLKGGHNALKLLIIDTFGVVLNSDGYFDLQIKKGWHNISISNQYDPVFRSFRGRKLFFRKKRTYLVDFYLTGPFPALYH